MAHGLVERERAHQLLEAPEGGALGAGLGVEQPLHAAEAAHRPREQVARDDAPVHRERHVGEHLRHHAEHEVAGLQDLAPRLERGHRLAALLEQHELVQLALDDGVHLVGVVAREARLAGVGEPVLVEEHERVQGGVQRVVAQEAERVGAADGQLVLVEDAERILERLDELARLLAVHDVAQAVVLAQARVGYRVEQGIGALVAQQERLGLVAGPADIAEEPVVDVLAEEVVRDESGHGAVPRF
ncbi:MAG: hypothetical protein V8S24_00885 [Gordonibacter pamelaeae]